MDIDTIKGTISKRIEDLLVSTDIKIQEMSPSVVEELIFSTESIMRLLYGDMGRTQVFLDTINQVRSRYVTYSYMYGSKMVEVTKGALKTIQADLKYGLLTSLEKQFSSIVVGDFLALAKNAINDGYKDVAAVLASAAIEDTLKRLAGANGLNVEDKDMSEVIGALKAKSILKGPQAVTVQSYVNLRNKAFHAQWDKIDLATVQSLISFMEVFLTQNFS